MKNKNYISKEDIKEVSESRTKANLIKDAIKIVDKLATIDIDDMTGYDKDNLEELIEKAIKLKKNRLWKLN